MSLKQQAVFGVKWSALSAILTGLFMCLRLAVLAHLLAPKDFGLIAMLMVVIGLAQAFIDLGLGNAIIQRQDITQRQLSSLYWLNIAGGVGIFLLVICTSSFVASFYHEPALRALLSWAALVFLVAPVGQQFQFLLQKHFQFAHLAKIQVTGAVLGTGVAISTAVAGAGAMALIWGLLTEVTVNALLYAWFGWRKWRPLFHFQEEDLRGFLSFGLYEMGGRGFNHFAAHVDYLLIGRVLGGHLLGVYTLAYQLVVLPLKRINPVLMRVAYPIFAKKQADKVGLQRGYLEVTRLLAFVVFPPLVWMWATAPRLIPCALGEGWDLAIPLIQILVPLGMLKTLGNPLGSILLATNRPDILFKWEVCIAFVNTAVFFVVVQHGVYALAVSYVLLTVVYFALTLKILQNVIGLSARRYFGVLTRPTMANIMMGTIVFVTSRSLTGIVPDAVLLLLALLALGIATYAGIIFVFEPTFISDMRALFRTRMKQTS